MTTRTEAQKAIYANNRKISCYNKKKSKISNLLLDDIVLKNADIDDLNDDAINDTSKLLKKVMTLNKLRAKLQSEGVQIVSPVADPALKAPRKIDIEPDEDLYKTLKTIYNPRNKKTQMMKYG